MPATVTLRTAAGRTVGLSNAEVDANVTELKRVADAAEAGNPTGYSSATPGLLRGTVQAHLWPGVTKGTGLASAARTANLTNLQAAVNHAATNRKFFEIEPGDYEIEGTAGLVIPQTKNTGFWWQGTKGSHIKQFSNNCPILTISDITGGTALMEQATITGLRVSYATDQRLNVGSTMIRLGRARNCTFREWNVFADSGATGWPAGSSIRAYRGIVLQHNTDTMSYFSNTMDEIMIGGCERNFLSFGWDVNNDGVPVGAGGIGGSAIQGGAGTGNVFRNIYMANGVTDNPQAINGHAIRLRGPVDVYESVFEQINIEWTIANQLVGAEICKNTTFLSWHLEGCRLSGADPMVFNLSGTSLNLVGLNLLDFAVNSAQTVTGEPAVFALYQSHVRGVGVNFEWSKTGAVNTTFNLVRVFSWSPKNQRDSCQITGLELNDKVGSGSGAFFQFTADMPRATFPAPVHADEFRWRPFNPEVLRPVIRVDASMTLYGCYRDATVVYPVAPAAARTLTLGATMRATGTLAAQPVEPGHFVTVQRDEGTANANAITVAPVNTTLTAAAQARYYRYNNGGTAWAEVT